MKKYYFLLSLLFSLLLFIGDTSGCGGDDPDPVPTYKEDPALSAAKTKLLNQASGLLDIPYEDYLSRFQPSQETQSYLSKALGGYQSLIDTSDYSLADYSDVENKYLDTVLRKYQESRDVSSDELKESLISQGLYESGPGYSMIKDFADETSQGITDISAEWAYENLDRQIQQQQYNDALQRGDYTAMYNLALGQAGIEQQAASLAQNAKMGGLTALSGITGQMTSEDLAGYNAALQAYQAQLAADEAGSGDLGGLGTLLGTGIGALLALPTGGMSVLAGGALGGMLGGSTGSLIGT